MPLRITFGKINYFIDERQRQKERERERDRETERDRERETKVASTIARGAIFMRDSENVIREGKGRQFPLEHIIS